MRKNSDALFLVRAETEAGARLQIEGALNKIASVQGPPAVGDRKISGSGSSSGFAVVIDGDTLRFALESDLKLLFLTLATQCETVICCRVSVSVLISLSGAGCRAEDGTWSCSRRRRRRR